MRTLEKSRIIIRYFFILMLLVFLASSLAAYLYLKDNVYDIIYLDASTLSTGNNKNTSLDIKKFEQVSSNIDNKNNIDGQQITNFMR